MGSLEKATPRQRPEAFSKEILQPSLKNLYEGEWVRLRGTIATSRFFTFGSLAYKSVFCLWKNSQTTQKLWNLFKAIKKRSETC